MMQLLSLRSIPIQIDMKVDHGALDYTHGHADLNIHRSTGGFQLHNEPIRLHIDTFEARSSIVPTAIQSVEQNAQQGLQAAGQAAAAYAQQGKRAMNVPIGGEIITQVAREQMFRDVKMNIGIKFIPTTGPNIQWTPGHLDSQYQPDQLEFQWQVEPPRFRHRYADVSFQMIRRPDVEITYNRPPIRVPRSQDPTYHPIDVRG